MESVNREVAAKEVQDWLDYKKVSKSKRENKVDSIEALTDAICDGVIIFKDDKSIEHTLKFPIGESESVKTLTYKPRITSGAVHIHLSGVKSTDIDGRLTAYIAALTAQSKEMIKRLDTEDTDIAQSIAIFFI